ncbi:ABC transporter ATP-binding protein [Pseudotabrizicola algicola]|uniref:ABC transporter ATP-binding protein n=1 Tax=Pseudotabrizicola algicola TaxID=2709381 RepID=A0A6B3RUM1_9RHOB|nr:ABC transporter ATP-binding protein [Pseudotabrizicola algicola]NEX46699.1 ABC transporter ATP-binding protein [Pseudotabrizicola algicola]
MAPVLSVRGLTTVFGTGETALRALDGVDLTVHQGEIVALVGESGSGKSLTGFSINGLLPGNAKVTGGSIRLGDTDLRALTPRQMRGIRGKQVGMIFQDPMMTLNPVLRVETQMRDALRAHSPLPRGEVRARLVQALAEVGIAAPEQRLRAWPHELSGGMRQRVAIATALLHSPQLVIADEPTTALDVTIQGQILALAQRLCRDRGTALVWITHDLAVVAGIADRVSVMYAGRVVEEGPVDAVLDTPAHPYTRGLIDSVAASQPKGARLPMIPGRMPLLSDLPQGCAFAPRCARRSALCISERPEPRATGAGQTVRCHHPLTEPAGAAA